MDHHDCRVHTPTISRTRQWIYVDGSQLRVAAADRLATGSCSKLLLHKPGPYYRLSSTTESVTIDKEDIPNTISSYRASLAPQSEVDWSMREASASHQFEYLEGLLGEYPPDLPIDTSDAQAWIGTGIILATNGVELLTEVNTMQLETTQNAPKNYER